MAVFDAGTARATYELDLAPLKRQIAEAKRLLEELKAQAKNIPVGGGTGSGGGGSNAPMQRQQNQTRQLADARLRLSLANADLAEKIRLLEREIASENGETLRSIRLQTELARARQRAANAGGTGPALPRTFAGFTPGGLAEIGGLVAGSAIAGATVNAVNAANELERVEATLRQLSQTQEAYAQNVALAEENQRIFGGTLAENIAAITRLQTVSNRTGVSVATLNQSVQLLTTLDPAQGSEGGVIALNELLSGETQSLVERFELPRSEIKGLLDLPLNERLEGLNAILGRLGVTQETIAAQTNTTAQTYRDFGIAVEGAATAIGGTLARSFEEAFTGATRLLEALNGNAEALAELRASSGDGVVDAEDLAEAQRDIARQRARDFTGGNTQRSEAQTNAAFLAAGQDLNALRAAIEDILVNAPALDGELQAIAERFRQTGDVNAYVAAVQALIIEYNTAETQSNGLGGALQQLEERTRAAFAAAQAEEAAVRENALAKIDQAARSADAARAEEELRDAYREAADEGLTASQIAERLKDEFGLTADQARQLTDDLAALNGQIVAFNGNGGGALGAGLGVLAGQAQAQLGRGSTGRTGTGAGSLVGRDLIEYNRQQEALAAAQANADRAREQAQREAERRRLAASRGSTRSVRNDAQREAEQARREAEREAERRLEEVRRANEQIEDEQRRHFDALRRSAEDYALSRSRDEEDFQRQRQRLLAEGRIFEARLLEEEQNIERRRAAEDQAIERRREQERFGQALAEIREDAGLSPAEAVIAAAASAPSAMQAATSAQAQASATGAAMLRIEFAPINLLLDGETVATAVYPSIEQQLDTALTAGVIAVTTTAPPINRNEGVGGPRA